MSEEKILLVLSAGRYNRLVFPEIQNLGYRVVAIDRDPRAEGFRYADAFEVVDVVDKDGALDVARRHGVDGVMAINDFGVMTAAHVSERLGLPGVTAETARATTDKGIMRQVWDDAGLAIPRFRIAHCLDGALDAAADVGLPLVVKPTNSGGAARGVSLVGSPTDIEWAYRFALRFVRPGGNVILENFLEGTELSVEALTHNGRTHVLAIGDKTHVGGKFQVTTSIHYPACFGEDVLTEVKRLVIEAVAAVGITQGASHTEVIVTPSGPKLVEMASRPGGGHIFSTIVREVSGVNMVQELAKILVGETPDLKPKFCHGCVYRFLTPPPGIVRAVDGVDEAARLPGVLDVAVTREVGERIPEVTNGLERSGFVVVGGQDRREAVERADGAERAVTFDIEPIPEDSGAY
jgi:biotin carboxylase